MAEALRLKALLPERLEEAGQRVREKLCENERVGAMNLAWDYVGSRLSGALEQALDCDAMRLFAKGWASADQLAGVVKLRPSTGGRSTLEIGPHEFKQELKPIIAVTIGPCPCVDIEFGFAVSANFSGVQLHIVDGHITGGEAGQAWASAQLSFEGVPLHDAVETRKVAIPATFRFDAPGVPIAPLAH